MCICCICNSHLHSERILLSHGRRHGSLLKSIVNDGETTLHIYTILEVTEFQIWNLWECFQMQRMRSGQCCLLSSICWRRSCYWKKGKGKPRVLQCDGARGVFALDQITFQRKTWLL